MRRIADLKARGLKVTLYPFAMLDIPAGNTLPDPYGGTGQPPIPGAADHLRPAPGSVGTPDKTATRRRGGGLRRPAAPDRVRGRRRRGDLFRAGRMGLSAHGAALCLSARGAGGVDTFLIGSELRGLTSFATTAGLSLRHCA